MWFAVVLIVVAVLVVAIVVRDLTRRPDPSLTYDPNRSALPPSEHVKGSSGWEGVTGGPDPGRGVGF